MNNIFENQNSKHTRQVTVVRSEWIILEYKKITYHFHPLVPSIIMAGFSTVLMPKKICNNMEI